MADDEFALRRAMERAARAQTLLEDELIAEAFRQIEADYIRGWKETPARDTEGREKLWIAMQVIGKVQAHLVSVVRGGQLAAAEIERDYYTPRKRFGIV